MLRLGVDVGGTFTDLVLMEHSAVLASLKVPTTPSDPLEGVLRGLTMILAEQKRRPAELRMIGHGTTIATNLLVEGKGARTALLTTQGFRDVLEFRRSSRHDRADLYDMFFDNPPDLVERRLRREVPERIRHDGSVERPLDRDALRRTLREIGEEGIEAIAVCFLHAYVNRDHEDLAAAEATAALPQAFVTTSAEVNPEILEYERTSTTVINAMLGPVCGSYFTRVQSGVAAAGIAASVNLMQSNGGLTTPARAARRPAALLESGPAGGVTIAAKLCRAIGIPHAITGDMGGTTFDVALVRHGQPEFRTSTEVATYTVRVPTIDIASVGAGGGSLAQVDRGGALKVGPESAGAHPGPACYGMGGELPTVTDCNLVLGYVDAATVVGGRKLDRAAAERAIRRHLAGPLGMGVEEAAHAVRVISNAQMAQAMRLVTVERGLDPRDFAYLAYGGGGPVHAIDLARELGIRRVVVPPLPGLFSAFGMAIADMTQDHQQAVLEPLATVEPSRLAALFAQLRTAAAAELAATGLAEGQVEHQLSADCRFLGQPESITVRLDRAPDDPLVATAIEARFRADHERQWGFELPGRRVILENVRLRSVGRLGQELRFPETAHGEAAAARRSGERLVHVGGRPQAIACFRRRSLPPGTRLVGPFIIEEESTNLVVTEPHRAEIDGLGNIIVTLEG